MKAGFDLPGDGSLSDIDVPFPGGPDAPGAIGLVAFMVVLGGLARARFRRMDVIV
ncbi:MAG: hypothetical protein M3P14_00435 [Chloroflexota bacterium]|nr:hypothetical protein [Chloroflexota bacterium]